MYSAVTKQGIAQSKQHDKQRCKEIISKALKHPSTIFDNEWRLLLFFLIQSLSSGGGYSISRVEHHSYLYTMKGRYVITKSSITWWITEKKYQPSKLSSPEINVWQCLRVYIDKFATICYTFTWLQAKLNTNILQETVEEENSSNFYRPSKSISC